MSGYELLTFLHIAAAIIWLGSGFLLAILVLNAERAGDHAKEAGYHAEMSWLAKGLFIPASLSTLILGVLLVIDGAWEFDQLWVVIGLVGWAISFGLGFFYFRPEGMKIGALAAERGPGDPEIAFRVRRLNIVDRLQVLLLFTVVADMVIKPTGDDGGVLVVAAVILAAGAAWAMTAIRSPGSAAGPPPAAPPAA